jgi:4-hydroxy-4-methyl-2-oxoglutarate aldolase
MSELGVVHRRVQRADADAVERLGRLGVATIHEAQGRLGHMQPYMRRAWKGARACGTAITVLAHPGDNWMMHVVAEIAQPGDLVVVGLTSRNTDGMFGDLLATSFQARGIKGLVIDSGVRDVTDLERMGFPVWSGAVSQKGTVKATVGSVNVPIVCGGAIVHPGDVVVGDDDGVVVVPAAQALAVASAGEAREANEESKRKRLAAGELGLDIYNMRDKLAKAGLRYID